MSFQWVAIRPEDSGVYICQAENSEGVSEIKVQVIVEGLPGAPLASVSNAEMTVVEGQTVTMECQASGKTASRFSYAKLSVLLPLNKTEFPSRFPHSHHHLVQAASTVAMETHNE